MTDENIINIVSERLRVYEKVFSNIPAFTRALYLFQQGYSVLYNMTNKLKPFELYRYDRENDQNLLSMSGYFEQVAVELNLDLKKPVDERALSLLVFLSHIQEEDFNTTLL